MSVQMWKGSIQKQNLELGGRLRRSIGPWRTSALPVRTVQATRDVPRSEQPSWSKVWESLSSRVRNALCVSEVSPSVCPVRLVGECWWTIPGLIHTEYRRCRTLQPQTKSRGALWQSRYSRRYQVSLTSFGPQMKPTSILTERQTPRQMSSGGPPDPIK